MPHRDEVIVVNTRGEESPFSVERIARYADSRGMPIEKGFEIGRQLLSDIRSEGCERVTTDNIRHWWHERDPQVLSTDIRQASYELMMFLERIPPDSDIAWIVPILQLLNSGTFVSADFERLPLPLQQGDKKKKVDKKKDKDKETEKKKQEYIKSIAKTIGIPGAPPPPPWKKKGAWEKKFPDGTGFCDKWWPTPKKKGTEKPQAVDVIHLDDPSLSRYFDFDSYYGPVTKCGQEFVLIIYVGDKKPDCKQVEFQSMFDLAAFKAAEHAVDVCASLDGGCTVASYIATVDWRCEKGTAVLDISVVFSCVCD